MKMWIAMVQTSPSSILIYVKENIKQCISMLRSLQSVNPPNAVQTINQLEREQGTARNEIQEFLHPADFGNSRYQPIVALIFH